MFKKWLHKNILFESVAVDKLLKLAQSLGDPYPYIVKKMIGDNPGRVEMWSAAINTVEDLKKKVEDWKRRGLIGDDRENQEKAKRDSLGQERINRANNDPAAWYRMLNDEQKRDLRKITLLAQGNHRIMPPTWLSRVEISLFNQVIEAGWAANFKD